MTMDYTHIMLFRGFNTISVFYVASWDYIEDKWETSKSCLVLVVGLYPSVLN